MTEKLSVEYWQFFVCVFLVNLRRWHKKKSSEILSPFFKHYMFEKMPSFQFFHDLTKYFLTFNTCLNSESLRRTCEMIRAHNSKKGFSERFWLHYARVRPEAHAMAKETVLTNAQYVLFLLLHILSVLSIFINVIKVWKFLNVIIFHLKLQKNHW